MPRATPPAVPPAPARPLVGPQRPEGVAAKRTAERDSGPPAGEVIPPQPAYFRTWQQVRAAMQALATTYPDLVTLEDIGDSGDKVRGLAPTHDVLALRLTARHADPASSLPVADRPKVLWLAGLHAREVANPELLLQWAATKLAGYGRDASATAALNTRQFLLVPIVNVDGHVVVEQGWATGDRTKLWQRKDTTAPDGVDVNRNFEHEWGGVGSSRNPVDGTYAGPAPASEPETQAVEAFVRRERPAIAVDWHSFSGLNLYPWGDSFTHTADDARLNSLAKKFSTMNGYVPEQSSDLYLNSGASDDWMYSVLAPSPAFTIETGDSFHQDDAEFATTVARNTPVMDWMSRAADDPPGHALGPDVSGLASGGNGTLVAHAVATDTRAVPPADSDAEPGHRKHPVVVPTPIAGAEWFTDPATAPGAGVAMSAADGGFSDLAEDLAAPLAAAQVRDGQLVWVRARDTEGHWGAASATFARTTSNQTTT